MKKLARNSLLAITAMAWLGQPVVADGKRTDGASQHGTVTIAADGGSAPEISRFSAGERALLSSGLRETPRTGAVFADAHRRTPLQPGDRLSPEDLLSARTLPATLQTALGHDSPDQRDLLIGHQVVRLAVPTRQVLDVLTLG
ncbi:hypothetical protein [Isoalcanivorax indicus]|uniref:hypothetical protein n=1 Tax=Isoalcanivorax indicus TaxID=2202653 RepID=UPI000DBA61A6|nr:hypothetical protein [Isoalcanivorax indicus]